MYLTGSTVTVSGASFTSCTASVRRTHNSRRHSRTAIAVRQPTPNIPRHTTQHHATPHLTSTAITTLHTSIPPEGQGPPLPTLPAMPYPSTRSLTHPHPESSSSSPPPPPIPHCHQHRTPLFQSSDDTTPHPMRPTLAPATNGPLTLHTLPPPSPSSSALRRSLSLTLTPPPPLTLHTHPLSNALLGGPLYRSVLAGRLRLPSSVHPHARHRHVILRT